MLLTSGGSQRADRAPCRYSNGSGWDSNPDPPKCKHCPLCHPTLFYLHYFQSSEQKHLKKQSVALLLPLPDLPPQERDTRQTSPSLLTCSICLESCSPSLPRQWHSKAFRDPTDRGWGDVSGCRAVNPDPQKCRCMSLYRLSPVAPV